MNEEKEETSENAGASETAQNGRSQEQIQAEEAQKHYQLTLLYRGIRKPCTACNGYGVRAYGSTATWIDGIGGAMITNDVCDRCWGSGDESHKGPNLRKLLTMITPEQFRELYSK